MNIRILPMALASAVVLLSRSAGADECFDAHERAVTLRQSKRLLAAREQFAQCATASCDARIAKICSTEAAEVEDEIPTLVLEVKDAGGEDIVDARVSVDGALVTERADGSALPLDPGAHTLRVEARGASEERTIVLREGEKARRERVAFAGPPVTPPALHAEPANDARPTPAREERRRSASSALPPVGWTLGASGLVGLGVGAIFGIDAMSKNSRAGCDAQSFCDDPQARRDAQSSATVATAAIVVGSALVAVGLTFVLLAPRASDVARRTPLLAIGPGGISGGFP